MHTRNGRRGWVLGVAVALLAAACGAGEENGPETRPVIAKTATKSGDVQTGIVGEPLPDDLRVVVTRDGAPAPGITVTWSTASGSLDPTSSETDADGVSSSTWTLGTTLGNVAAAASVPNATGSPETFAATAIAGTPTGSIVQVLTDGSGNRFSPTNILVQVGTTVTWVWGTNATGHNIRPDVNGGEPTGFEDLRSAPSTYQYTFNTVGTFDYYCSAHGGPNGVGMSGIVTVVSQQP